LTATTPPKQTTADTRTTALTAATVTITGHKIQVIFTVNKNLEFHDFVFSLAKSNYLI
jgi:hypothetical protein